MNKYQVGMTLILLLVATSAMAKPHHGKHHHKKKQGQPVEIVFNEEGRMIAFPKSVLHLKDVLCFKVLASKTTLQKQKNRLGDYLKKASKEVVKNVDFYNCVNPNLKSDSFNSTLINRYDALSLCSLTQKDLDSFKSNTLPIYTYVTNLLQKQFELKVYVGSICVEDIYLKPQNNFCTDTCIWFKPDYCYAIKDRVCKTCRFRGIDSLQFQIIRHD